MSTICEKRDDNLYIKPEGILDSNTTKKFEDAMMEALDASLGSIIIDMENVEYISSKGLRAIVSAYKKMGGNEFVLDNVNDAVYEVLKLTGMLNVFTIKRK